MNTFILMYKRRAEFYGLEYEVSPSGNFLRVDDGNDSQHFIIFSAPMGEDNIIGVHSVFERGEEDSVIYEEIVQDVFLINEYMQALVPVMPIRSLTNNKGFGVDAVWLENDWFFFEEVKQISPDVYHLVHSDKTSYYEVQVSNAFIPVKWASMDLTS